MTMRCCRGFVVDKVPSDVVGKRAKAATWLVGAEAEQGQGRGLAEKKPLVLSNQPSFNCLAPYDLTSHRVITPSRKRSAFSFPEPLVG